MSDSWEVDEEKLICSKKCNCGQGTVDKYQIKLSHKKVDREKIEFQTVVNCTNPNCTSIEKCK